MDGGASVLLPRLLSFCSAHMGLTLAWGRGRELSIIFTGKMSLGSGFCLRGVPLQLWEERLHLLPVAGVGSMSS